jgi:hypothetical protein
MYNLLVRIGAVSGSLIIIITSGILIILVYLVKLFSWRRVINTVNDPFHDSRRHPLNDLRAPRG